MKYSILFLVFAMFLFTQSASSQSKVSPVATKISEKDNGKTFRLKKYQLFDVTFEKECVGCAKVWQITKIDSLKIVYLSKTYTNRSCTDCTGGTHDNTFHFKVKKAGKSKLSFEYFDKKFAINIVAK